jgi:hypothetical protein
MDPEIIEGRIIVDLNGIRRRGTTAADRPKLPLTIDVTSNSSRGFAHS